MKRNKYKYGVLTIDNGNTFIDRFKEEEIENTLKKVGLRHSSKLKFFDSKREAYSEALKRVDEQIDWYVQVKKRLMNEQ